MQTKRTVVALMGALLAISALAKPAGAVALVDTAGGGGGNPFIVIGNEIISETNCASALCAGLQMIADPNAPLGVIIESATGGQPILTSSQGDLTLGLSVTGNLKIGAVGLGVTGIIGNGGHAGDVNVSEAVNGVQGFAVANAGITWIPLASGFSSLSITKDMTAAGGRQWCAGDKLMAVVQDFRPVPEPASLAVLAAGLIGAAVVRRRRLV